jgi:hypothetical protein
MGSKSSKSKVAVVLPSQHLSLSLDRKTAEDLALALSHALGGTPAGGKLEGAKSKAGAKSGKVTILSKSPKK